VLQRPLWWSGMTSAVCATGARTQSVKRRGVRVRACVRACVRVLKVAGWVGGVGGGVGGGARAQCGFDAQVDVEAGQVGEVRQASLSPMAPEHSRTAADVHVAHVRRYGAALRMCNSAPNARVLRIGAFTAWHSTAVWEPVCLFAAVRYRILLWARAPRSRAGRARAAGGAGWRRRQTAAGTPARAAACPTAGTPARKRWLAASAASHVGAGTRRIPSGETQQPGESRRMALQPVRYPLIAQQSRLSRRPGPSKLYSACSALQAAAVP
jgi:hypothetical protein